MHIHTHRGAHTHTHSFPFSPPLIMFLYLTFKVPEIGMFLNQNCFSKRALAEMPIPFWSCSAFWVILFGQPRAVSCAQRVRSRKVEKWFDLIMMRWHAGRTGQGIFCLYCALAASSRHFFFPRVKLECCYWVKTISKPVGKFGQMLCSGYEMGSEG